MSRLDNLRAADLGFSLIGTNVHTNSKMHEVYALNVLSDAHMNWPVDGTSLTEWIEVGGQGELFNTKQGLTLWTLNIEIKLRVRCELFNKG